MTSLWTQSVSPCRQSLEDPRNRGSMRFLSADWSEVAAELLDRASDGPLAAIRPLLIGRSSVSLIKNDQESTLWRIGSHADTEGLAFVVKVYNNADGRVWMEREVAVLRLVLQRRFPVPRVVDSSAGSALFPRAFMVMECVPGLSLGVSLQRGRADATSALVQAGKLLRQLHSLPVIAAELHPGIPRHDASCRVIDELSAAVARAGLTELFSESLDYLRQTATALLPGEPDLCFVHGDFHPGNVLDRGGGELVVVDWTMAGWRDPRYDLAWTTVQMSPVPDDPKRAALLSGYTARGDRGNLIPVVCEAFACLRGLANAAGLEGRGPPVARQFKPARLRWLRNLAARWQTLTGLLPPYEIEVLSAGSRFPTAQPGW